jgi:glycosyltransferase involved in cell wall biosynthesis
VKISVVTPSLNQGRFIGDAVESVLAQAGSGEIEHIIVDGGSTDATHDVLSRYPHLNVLRDEGLGQSHALNIGFRAATGEMIGWLNADDRYAPGAFRAALHAFAEHEDAGIVYGNARVIDETGDVIDEIRSGHFDLEGMLNGINPIPQPAVFIRAEILQRVGLTDESLHYVMDFELWLRAARATRLLWIDATLADFRKHPESKTVSQTHAFWPEKRAVARAYGGPFFSQDWRQHALNRSYPRLLIASLLRRGLKPRKRFRTLG